MRGELLFIKSRERGFWKILGFAVLRGVELICLLANDLITNREGAKNAKRRGEKRKEEKRCHKIFGIQCFMREIMLLCGVTRSAGW
jgi:hypothetical protein